jgi:glycosyltransferase involved in cell wall biosynthesis
MKKLSFIIPVYNEEKIIAKEVEEMIYMAGKMLAHTDYEILLVENGSTDHTKDMAQLLDKTHTEVRIISLLAPSYGKAVKTGLLNGDGEYLVLFNIDLWDIVFVKRALELCEARGYDIVVGSKTMRGAKDLRPWLRKAVTRTFNFVLRLIFGFRGTDTHGMKVLRRSKIIPIVNTCHTDREIFDTELLIRAQKAGLRMTEIPVVCMEKRKSTYGVFKRTPRTLKDLFVLFFTLR